MRRPRAANRPRISEPTPLKTSAESSDPPAARGRAHVLARLSKKNTGITDSCPTKNPEFGVRYSNNDE
jgi:hypothetical protein